LNILNVFKQLKNIQYILKLYTHILSKKCYLIFVWLCLVFFQISINILKVYKQLKNSQNSKVINYIISNKSDIIKPISVWWTLKVETGIKRSKSFTFSSINKSSQCYYSKNYNITLFTNNDRDLVQNSLFPNVFCTNYVF